MAKGPTEEAQPIPDQLQRYNEVIKDQLEQGIVEIVHDPPPQGSRTHYLPHHGVIRQDKQTQATDRL